MEGRWSMWSGARVARLGFLIGLGWESRDIAADPLVDSTSATVRAQARRLGLTFRAATGFRLPHTIMCRYEAAAARRGLSREALLNLLLVNVGSDDALIDNLLDDDA